jgi:hypothetical protein
MAELLVRVDPATYRKYIVKDKKGNNTLYVELTKALYGTCCNVDSWGNRVTINRGNR